MTQEEKQLLLIDLCARLYHDTKVETKNGQEFLIGIEYGESFIDEDTIVKTPQFTTEEFGGRRLLHDIEEIKPYLRPMSSMTKEEVIEYLSVCDKDYKDSLTTLRHSGADWLNAHHFDYRGLIEKGLALEAPEGMYKTD